LYKLPFDVDDVEKVITNDDILVFVTQCIEVLNKSFKTALTLDMVLISSAHTDSKHSFHIVFPIATKWNFMKTIFNLVFEKVVFGSKLESSIDSSVYKSKQAYRILYQTKMKKNNPLLPLRIAGCGYDTDVNNHLIGWYNIEPLHIIDENILQKINVINPITVSFKSVLNKKHIFKKVEPSRKQPLIQYLIESIPNSIETKQTADNWRIIVKLGYNYWKFVSDEIKQNESYETIENWREYIIEFLINWTYQAYETDLNHHAGYIRTYFQVLDNSKFCSYYNI
jgi:hypothetical protein